MNEGHHPNAEFLAVDIPKVYRHSQSHGLVRPSSGKPGVALKPVENLSKADRKSMAAGSTQVANMDDLSKFDVQRAVEGLKAAPLLRPYSALQQKKDANAKNNTVLMKGFGVRGTRPRSAVERTNEKLNPHYYNRGKFMQTRVWAFDNHFKDEKYERRYDHIRDIDSVGRYLEQKRRGGREYGEAASRAAKLVEQQAHIDPKSGEAVIDRMTGDRPDILD